MKKWWWSLALLLFAFGCDNGSKQAGGPGSETTNGIYAVIYTENGSLAHSAVAALRKADFVSDDTTGAVFHADFAADSAGALEIPEMEKGVYRVTISVDGEIYSKEISLAEESLDLGQIHLEKPGSISGNLSGKSAQWVGIYGLDILAQIDSLGNFTLEGIPAGELKLYALDKSLSSILADTALTVIPTKISTWIHAAISPKDSTVKDTIRDTTQVNPPKDSTVSDTTKKDTTVTDTTSRDSLVWQLFEDFEDSASFAKKAWYFSDDSSLATINFPTDFAWKGVVSSEERKGHVFSGYYSTPAIPTGKSYVIFGTQISATGIDMSKLDSITFYAKGSGALKLSLERWEKAASDNLKAWTADIPLSTSWTPITVTPADFLSPESDTLSTGWESVKSTVTRLHFFGIGGSELSLDDIKIYGKTTKSSQIP